MRKMLCLMQLKVIQVILVLLFVPDVTTLSTIAKSQPGCRPTADVLFLIDGSDSISDEEFKQQRDFIKRFVRLSDISLDSIRVGFSVVSSTIGDSFLLNASSSHRAVTAALSGITQPQDGSRTDIGLVEMDQMFSQYGRPGVLRICVVLTDGHAKYEKATVAEAKIVKDAGVFLVAIGVGRLIKFGELEKIASTRSNAYHLIPLELSSKLLSETVKFLGKESCAGHALVDKFKSNPSMRPNVTSQPQSLSTQQQKRIHVPSSIMPQSKNTTDKIAFVLTATGITPKNPTESSTVSTLAPPTSATSSTPPTTAQTTNTPPTTQFKALTNSSNVETPTTTLKTTASTTATPTAQTIPTRKPAITTKPTTAVPTTLQPTTTPKPGSGFAINIRGGLVDNRVPSITVGNGLVGKLKTVLKLQTDLAADNKIVLPKPEPSKPKPAFKQLFDMGGLGGLKLTVPFKIVKERATFIPTTPQPTTTPTTTTKMPTTTVPEIIRLVSNEFATQQCAKAQVIDGIGYTFLPNSCTDFIKCYERNGTSYVQTGRCPFEMFFDDKNAVCKYHEKGSCRRDPCLDDQIISYKHIGNCRAYWNCNAGKSTPKCCPSGSSYIPGRECVRNVNCIDPCMDFGNINIVTKASECKLLPMETNPLFYFEQVAGIGWVIRHCAQGSEFNQGLCGCHATDSVVANNCNPELHMDFNNGLNDISGNGLALGNTNVDIEGGAGSFDGKAFIKLWRFSGVSLGQKLSVSFRFRPSVKAPTGRLMHIVSNCCFNCKTIPRPSIDIAVIPMTDKGGIAVFSATTATAGEIFVYVPYKDTFTGWNHLTFTYDGIQLTGSINGKTAHKNIIGDIEARTDPLSIGACGQSGGYQGYLDDGHYWGFAKWVLCSSGNIVPFVTI